MAITISRTALNALVDDDGSNTLGSAWNKASIGSVIMDPIDALLTNMGSTAFTPGLAFGGASVLMTFTRQLGLYAKVGQTTFFTLRITLSETGTSAGAATVTGLPFTVVSTANVGFQSVSCSFYASMVNATSMAAYTILNTTTLQLVVPEATTVTNMIEANFSDTSDFIISGTYLAAP